MQTEAELDRLVDAHDYYRAMTQGSAAERRFHPRRIALIRSLIPPGGRILDLGSSSGPLAVPLLAEGREVVAVDLGMEHLQALRRYAGTVEAAAIQADGRRLPFADDTFDTVVVASVVHLIPAPGPLLREAERVCRPAGRIVVAGPLPLHPKSNALIKTLLRGGKAPDGRQYPFDLRRLRGWLSRSTLAERRIDWLVGVLGTAWTPDRKPPR